MAPRRIHIDSHVSLSPTERSSIGDCRDVFAEGGGVERITKGKEGRQTAQRGIVKAIEICEIARLEDLVDVGLFGREGEVFLDLFADIAEKRY